MRARKLTSAVYANFHKKSNLGACAASLQNAKLAKVIKIMYNFVAMKKDEMRCNINIPREVRDVIETLARAGFEAYAVGGCVRDLLLGRKPSDWDVATSAAPEEIRKIFPESFYENKFFTVTVKTESADQALREIEITTFRSEERYRDHRHPEEVKPAKTIEEDLSRRDFTVNAMALDINPKQIQNSKSSDSDFVSSFKFQISNFILIDPFGGQKDLEAKLIRAVGEPDRRFNEDALRMLRAIRLAAELKFSLEEKTKQAIEKNHQWLEAISKERIRDEFSKIIMADEGPYRAPDKTDEKIFGALTDAPSAPARGESKGELLKRIGAGQAWRNIELLREVGLLQHIVPELEEGIGSTQNKHHIYTSWEHNMRALDYAAKQSWPLAVRIASLFHDIAKPRSKAGEGPDSTFYGHDVLGGKMSCKILTRLRYPEKFVERVAKLVRWHLFRYDYDVDAVETTDSSIRRLIRNVGVENIEDLVKVRMCDRIGSGVPKAVPYRLRHFQFRVEKVLREHEAVKVTMLQIGGGDVMKILGIPQSPKVGHVLNALLEEVLDDPAKNAREYLESKIRDLGALSDGELIKLREQTETRVELLEDQREQEIKKKYYVR